MVLRKLKADPIAMLIVIVGFTLFGMMLTFFRSLSEFEWMVLMVDILFTVMGLGFFVMAESLWIQDNKPTDYGAFVVYFMVGTIVTVMMAALTMLGLQQGSSVLTPGLGTYFDQFAAISEDLFFCGMLALTFSFFKNYDFTNPYLVFFIVAVVIIFQAVFFMLWHTVVYGGNPGAMAYVFGLRIILSTIFVLSGLLLTPIAVHMLVNFLAGIG
jgi:hypothetical protein